MWRLFAPSSTGDAKRSTRRALEIAATSLFATWSISGLYGRLDNRMISVARTAIVMRFERADFDSLLTRSPMLQAKIIADTNYFVRE